MSARAASPDANSSEERIDRKSSRETNAAARSPPWPSKTPKVPIVPLPGTEGCVSNWREGGERGAKGEVSAVVVVLSQLLLAKPLFSPPGEQIKKTRTHRRDVKVLHRELPPAREREAELDAAVAGPVEKKQRREREKV